VALATAAYAVRGIARHRTFGSTGFDLGLFDQVLWHAGRLERLASSLKGLDWIFGDHLSPALALLAPAGWLGPEGLVGRAIRVRGRSGRRTGPAQKRPTITAQSQLRAPRPPFHRRAARRSCSALSAR